jgi:DNA-binding SARP family transcriptional activator/tetratricopeptide (TPR) repeat protein
MGTEFLLLGPLAVRADGSLVPVPSAKQRAILAALLLRANRVVTLDDLAEVLWGADLPSAARTGVQNYVARLRQALGPAGLRITTQPGGYLIRVEPGELDLGRFEDLLREARAAARDGRWPDAAGEAAAALALWRGDPLADVASDLLAAREGQRLSELRLQALDTRIDADLHLDRHAEVIGELRQLAATHPLRERLHGLLMLALYRDGRQGDALAAYRDARNVLIDQLGAEPGPDLQRLHQQILNSDPALILTASVAATPASASAVPRELPGDVAAFTGRSAELAELDRILLRQPNHPDDAKPTAAVISALSGTAGVGKTALAVHWAHHVTGSFPDGQLYVNLRGYDADQPMPSTNALAAFLRSLGVPGQDIPPLETERAARYRSLLVGMRMLIVLDNASTDEQVRSLLPGQHGCAVVVTSRDSLAGLVVRDGAARVDLDLLPAADAIALFRELIGARVDAEPAAAAALTEQCARLPLALRVAAELAVGRPDVPLANLVTELASQQHRLDQLHAGGDPATSVRAVFSWSYQQLSAGAARMFRLLGLHPGPDVSVPAAASLAGVSEPDARGLVRELARAHLIAERVPGRYGMHDLLHAYAAEQARAHDRHDERVAAIGRVLDYYLHTAARAALLLMPSKEPIILAPPRPGVTPAQPADHAQGMAWFEAEHQVLLAAVSLAAGSGLDSHAWQLPWALASFLQPRGHLQEWAAIQRTALAASIRVGDGAAQALCSRLLAAACTDLGDYDQARGHYASSLTLYQQLGNRLGEAKTHQNLCGLAEAQGRYADALGHAEQALRLYQSIGDQASEAVALNAVGWCHGLLDDYEQARAFCRQSLTLCGEIGYGWLEGTVWDSLGYAEHHLGNFAEAAACYERAVGIARVAGDRIYEAEALIHLGETRLADRHPNRAREAWQQALIILDDIHHPDADEVRAKLAGTSDHADGAESNG